METITDPTSLILLPLVILLLGIALGWFVSRGYLKGQFAAELERSRTFEAAERASLTERVTARDTTILELRQENTQLVSSLGGLQESLASQQSRAAELAERLRSAAEEQARLEKIQQQFSDAFRALSAEALQSNNQMFLDLAQSALQKFQETARGDLDKRQVAIQELVKPVRESLDRFDSKIQELEKARVGAYEGLNQQVRSLLETQTALRSETGNLVKALGTPRVRGRWGEIQLRRVVELAGMLDHCDFSEQASVTTETGRLRPDLIIHLPGGKSLVVDAKAPLAGYLEALEASDENIRRLKLQDHSRQLRDHALSLGKKAYWDQFSPAPEFVVLFIPGEAFFSAALENAPDLIEQSVAERVLIATPTTLIALLKAVAYGWRQERLAQNAEDISALGKELYKRLGDVAANFSSLGAGLSKAVESYNKAVNNLESRVLVSARRFKELDSTGVEKEIEPLQGVEHRTRELQSEELTGPKLIS